MKKTKKVVIIGVLTGLIGFALGIGSFAQNLTIAGQVIKKCGTVEMTQKLIDENPHLLPEILKAEQKLEEHTQKFIGNKTKSKKYR